MKKTTLFKSSTGTIALSLLLLTSTQTVFANPYSSTKTVALEDGTSIDIVVANSPATPPGGMVAAANFATVSAVTEGDIVKISGVPAFNSSYGSSAIAGAMIAGYYDRTGYPNMYTGPTNGGVMPLENLTDWGWGSYECPLSATKNGLDGRTIRGHVDDYFVATNTNGPDPYDGNWTEHTIGDCTGDYMKTSKWFPNSSNEPIFAENINKDGAAVFILSSAGDPVTASYLEGTTYNQYDAGYGLKLFFESRGYTVTNMYNQYINPYKTSGFTYEQYKAEIDADRPVMLHLSGHIVVGIGYNKTNNEITFHDSWDHSEHTMTWGGTYNTLFTHNAVTIVTLEELPSSFSWTMFLPAIISSK